MSNDLINKDDLDLQVMNSDDVNELRKIDDLFKMTRLKKEILRVRKWEHIQDRVVETTMDRAERGTPYMNNLELLNFLKVAQASADRSRKIIDELTNQVPSTVPSIQNNLTVNVLDVGDRESRDRVTRAVQAMMEQIQKTEAVMVESIKEDIVQTKERLENEKSLKEDEPFLKGE